MIKNINSKQNITPTQSLFNKDSSSVSSNGHITEDTAIISAEAKLLNELEKYHAGESDEINLALTNITSRYQIEGIINTINVKNEMMETIINLGD